MLAGQRRDYTKKGDKMRNFTKYLNKYVLVIVGIASTNLLSGCSPAGPIPPPIGPGWEGLVLLVLISVIVYVALDRWKNKTTTKHEYSESELDDIKERLKLLEKDIQNIKNKGENHD